MSLTLILSILLLAFGSLSAIFLARYSWMRRPAIGSTRFSVLMLSIAIWCFGYGMELLTPGITGKLAWARVQYFGIALFPIAWLSFVLAHTGHWKLLRWRNIVWLSIIPALTLIIMLTNEIHGLLWQDLALSTARGVTVLDPSYGFWFWVHTTYSYLIILSAYIILLSNWRHEIVSLYRWNAVPLLLSILLVPWTANILYLVGITAVDFTPFTFLVGVLITGHYILRFRVFDIAPVAQKAIIASINEPLLALDAEGRLLFFNEAAQPLLGTTPREWIGRDLTADWPELANLPVNSHSPIVLTQTDNGRDPIYFDAHVAPLYEGDQRQGGRLITLHDVTERQTQDTLRDDLTHTMVHDLRAPITNTLFALEILRRNMEQDGSSAENQRLLAMTHTSTQKTLHLVNQLLDIGRLENGTVPVDLHPIALNSVVNTVISTFEPQIELRNIHLICNISTTLPKVLADEALLGRVLQNLLDNSLKFTPDGGTIRLLAIITADPRPGRSPLTQPKLLVSITDSGPGIPDSIQNRIFDKYVTAGAAHAKGTGLGLAFCKMVLNAHHEDIWIETQPNAGATFAFTLTLATAPQPVG